MTTLYNLQTRPTKTPDNMSEFSEPSIEGTPVPHTGTAIPLSNSSVQPPTMATGSTVLVERYNLLLEQLAALEDRPQEPAHKSLFPRRPLGPHGNR